MKKFMAACAIFGLILVVFAVPVTAQTTWSGIDWGSICDATLTVTTSGDMEVEPFTATDYAGGHYNTHSSFRATDTPWVEVSFLDDGGSNRVQLWMEDETFSTPDGGAWTQFGSWDNQDNYMIYWWDYDTDWSDGTPYDSGDGWVDTGVPRSAGEHTLKLAMRSSGVVDYWLDGVLVHSTTDITPNYFGDIYLACRYDTAVFTDYRAGTDYDPHQVDYGDVWKQGFSTTYFPHVANDDTWETEICIINTSTENNLNAELKAYNNSGQQVATITIALAANARRQIIVGDEFPEHSSIGYMILESNVESVCGYTKFYVEGKYRVAIPASSEVNIGDIYISHIASNSNWWTRISLLNTNSSSKEITIEFNDGTIITKTIAAKEHQAFSIKSLFHGKAQPNINSAIIKNGAGIVGLELFGSYDSSGDNYLSGILLKDGTATDIYYPHIASNSTWWTGVVAYNPFASPCTLQITPYKTDGTALFPQTISLNGYEKYIGTVKNLNFPAETVWFSIKSSGPITGFELFAANDGSQLGGYTGVGISGTDGVFAKIEKTGGWTGIAFVNIEDTTATVTMHAYNDNGNLIATETLSVGAYAKIVGVVSNFFSQNVSNATYISYSSNKNVVGFQLNGSSDGMLLDGLPAMYGVRSTPSLNVAGTWNWAEK